MHSIKYPRTPHLPFSPSYSHDDEHMCSIENFVGENIIVTEKMDGENTTLYGNHWHARSLNSKRKHESRDWLANFWAGKKGKIPEGFRICGENLYAKHTIHYTNLPSYFLGFSVWEEDNLALSWKNTVDFLNEVGILPVPVLYEGAFSWEALTTIANRMTPRQEGFVVRLAMPFHYNDFGRSVAKWVRMDHVQPNNKHWFSSEVTKNGLRLLPKSL